MSEPAELPTTARVLEDALRAFGINVDAAAEDERRSRRERWISTWGAFFVSLAALGVSLAAVIVAASK